jgi:hypothetical protein
VVAYIDRQAGRALRILSGSLWLPDQARERLFPLTLGSSFHLFSTKGALAVSQFTTMVSGISLLVRAKTVRAAGVKGLGVGELL